jgi:hypothetical protein
MFVCGKYSWPYSRIREAEFDLKAATLVLLEQGSKHRWGIEFQVIEKVNRSIHAYKRGGSHIADDAVVLNGLKTPCFRTQLQPRCPPVAGSGTTNLRAKVLSSSLARLL